MLSLYQRKEMRVLKIFIITSLLLLLDYVLDVVFASPTFLPLNEATGGFVSWVTRSVFPTLYMVMWVVLILYEIVRAIVCLFKLQVVHIDSTLKRGFCKQMEPKFLNKTFFSNYVAFGLLICSYMPFSMAAEVAANSKSPNDGIVLLNVDNEPIANKSLCSKNEVVVFSCETKKSKTVSLCTTPDYMDDKGNAKKGGVITYRYGKDSHSIELEYPKDNKPAASSFKQLLLFERMGYLGAVSFHLASYRYSVFLMISRQTRDSNVAGVVVDDKGKLLSFDQRVINTAEYSTKYEYSYLNDLGLPDAGQDNRNVSGVGQDISFIAPYYDSSEDGKAVDAIRLGNSFSYSTSNPLNQMAILRVVATMGSVLTS